MHITTCCVVILALVAPEVLGHGYLQDPPSRSSMWRFGFNTPRNYNDNQLFCGGFDRQWNKNGGKCGVCGDPWDDVRENEAGGRYATGTISKRYKEGQIIKVQVKITASHLGYFEFRLCPHNNPGTPVTQQCLDQYVLHQPNGNTRYMEQGRPQVYTVTLKLPAGITCSQCVLQWKYNSGNNYGKDRNGNSCKGCGNQEQFYGCADIAVDPSSSGTFQQSTNGHDSSQPVSSGQNLFQQIGSGYGSSQQIGHASFQQIGGGYGSYQHVQQYPQIGVQNPFLNSHINPFQVCAATPQYRSVYPLADQFCIASCRQGYCPIGYCNDACRVRI